MWHLSTIDDLLWYPNSGSSYHITNNFSIYTEKRPYEGADMVKRGNGEGLSISHIGFAHIHFSYDDKTLFLNDIFHVYLITKNLINISNFSRDNNVFFQFHSKHSMLLVRIPNNFFYKAFLKMTCIFFMLSNLILITLQIRCLLLLIMLLWTCDLNILVTSVLTFLNKFFLVARYLFVKMFSFTLLVLIENVINCLSIYHCMFTLNLYCWYALMFGGFRLLRHLMVLTT